MDPRAEETDESPDGQSGPQHDLNKVRTPTVQVACEPCRKKHLKCDGTMPSCIRCGQLHLECSYIIERKKRGPKPGAKVKRKASPIKVEVLNPPPTKRTRRKEPTALTEESSNSGTDDSSSLDAVARTPGPTEMDNIAAYRRSPSSTSNEDFSSDLGGYDDHHFDDVQYDLGLAVRQTIAKQHYHSTLVMAHTTLVESSILRIYMQGYRQHIWPSCLTPPRNIESFIDSDDPLEITCAYSTLALGARTQGNLGHANEFISKAKAILHHQGSLQPHYLHLGTLNAIAYYYKMCCDFSTAAKFNAEARALSKKLLESPSFRDAPWPRHLHTQLNDVQSLHLRHLCFEPFTASLSMGHETRATSAATLAFLTPLLARYQETPHDILCNRFVKAVCIMPMVMSTPMNEMASVESKLMGVLQDVIAATKVLEGTAIRNKWLFIVYGLVAVVNMMRGNFDVAMNYADQVVTLLRQCGPGYYDQNSLLSLFWVAQIHMRLDYTKYLWGLEIYTDMSRFNVMAFFVIGYLRVLERDIPLFNTIPMATATIPIQMFPPDPTPSGKSFSEAMVVAKVAEEASQVLQSPRPPADPRAHSPN